MEMQRLVAQQREERTRKFVTLDKIFENFKEGHISFVGIAGSGKTTLMKEISQYILSGKCENFKDIEVVHFANVREFNKYDSITVGELLFRNVEPPLSDSEIQEAMKFAKENPTKVLFVNDSLDTIPYQVDGVYKSVTAEERSSPENALSHILSDKLLKGCRFITSTREHAIRNYKGSLQPQKVIALAGFSKESRRIIAVGYLAEKEGDEFMAFLETKPILEALCATPVWLIFMLMVWQSTTEDRPTTMAGILSVLLHSMIRSEHTHVKGIEEVVKKLTHMAFTGTREHRVLFSVDELWQYKLKADEVTDLVVITPGGMQQKILHGCHVMYYGHESLQEQLTSYHAARLPLQEFTEFANSTIYEPHYAVVKSLLSGVLLNEEVFQLSSNFLVGGTDYEEKKVILKKSLLHQLKSTRDHRDLLHLYSAFREAGDSVRDIIQSNVHDVRLNSMALSPFEAYSIGWVMAQQDVINMFYITGSPLTYASATALQNGLGDSSVSVKEMCIEMTDPDSLSVVGQIVQRHVDELTVFNGSNLACKIHVKRAEKGQNEDEIFLLDISPRWHASINAAEIAALIAPFQWMKISRMYIDGYLMSHNVEETENRREFVHETIKNCKVDEFRSKADDLEKIDSELLRNIKKLEIVAGRYFKASDKGDELNRRISVIAGILNKCGPATYISLWVDDLIVADSDDLGKTLASAKELRMNARGFFKEIIDGGDMKKKISVIGDIINKYATHICLCIELEDLKNAGALTMSKALKGVKIRAGDET